MKNPIVQSKTKEIKIDNETILKIGIPKVKDLLETLIEMDNDQDVMQLVSSVLVELETANKTIDLKTETKEEKIKMLESMSRDQYKIIKEYVLNGFFIMNFNYQTSDGIERTVKVSDFANFLRFYLGTLI
jgi:beta-xylosidase